MNNINSILASISLVFENPLYLLILVPGVVLAFWPYFRMKKEKRRTRNRIISMIIHLLILTLAAFVLSGFTIKKDNELKQDETIILVDISDSNYGNAPDIDSYIRRVVAECDSANKLGIVAFGCGEPRVIQDLKTNVRLPANFTAFDNNADSQADKEGYVRYEGTDIAGAMEYAKNMFSNGSSGQPNSLDGTRIIILSDGLETDGIASDKASELGNLGVVIDSVYFEPVRYDGKNEILISNLEASDSAPKEKAPISFTATIKAHAPVKSAKLTLVDYAGTGKDSEMVTMDISIDASEINAEKEFLFDNVAFEGGGVHPVRVELSDIVFENESNDNSAHSDWYQNNKFYSYVIIQTKSNSVLIVDGSNTGVPDLVSILSETEGGKYEVTVANYSTCPASISEYGEVILVDIDSKKLPSGFDATVERYVKNGGGLLVMGGEHTFYNGGMQTNKFANVLPINVKPQQTDNKAVMLCIDYSSAMCGADGERMTYNGASYKIIEVLRMGLQKAISGGAFSEDDYVGIYLFGGKNEPAYALPITNAYNILDINKVVDSLGSDSSKYNAATNPFGYMSNTEWRRPLELAAQKLNAFSPVDTKHIIFITDGAGDKTEGESAALSVNGVTYPVGGWKGYTPAGQPSTSYGSNGKCFTGYIYDKYDGITTSTILVSCGFQNPKNYCEKMAEDGKGRYYDVSTPEDIATVIDDECRSIPKKVVNTGEDYTLSLTQVVKTETGVDDATLPVLKGFNGCTPKANSTTYIETASDPIYIQWNYFAGKAGAFMSDISKDEWTNGLLRTNEGKAIFKWMTERCFNAGVSGLTDDADYVVERKNFTTTITISELSNKAIEYIEAYAYAPDSGIDAAKDKTNFDKLCPDDPEKYHSMVSAMGSFVTDFEIMQEGLWTLTFYRSQVVNDIQSCVDAVVPYTYVTFSYSDEYDTFSDPDAARQTLSTLCGKTGGTMIVREENEDGEDITDSIFSDDFQFHSVVINPQIWFMVAVLLLFIFDICVRKFNIFGKPKVTMAA